ncbi:hypothetical protein A2397_04945 [Candidatus Amesbacteria bacterium RIFOXYB1_FULL_44_23]|uniref:ComEC/Rec2-related protein domain-containing protein n=1 Tax=Candidatus Amesbacteria bacterium RIFOXYB1_FULL_44_23 TaxID=1797263 RepID=A0A1F4ZSI6_9BACT|nr:MAG: hypothetical protein A2397_04945 [Candidatus Amesbacteria bacterium RIFOXYB1_FULL_44_23]
MGFFIILLQSILKFDFIKASIVFLALQGISIFVMETPLEIGVIKLLIFVFLSYLVSRFEDSIFKWLVVVISAGLILG